MVTKKPDPAADREAPTAAWMPLSSPPVANSSEPAAPVLPAGLAEWVEDSLRGGRNVLASDSQGTLLLYRDGGHEFVVKTVMGNGLLRRARQATLNREYRAYQRMRGLTGVPRCLGMVAGRHLVLELIHGQPYREAEIADRDSFFAELLAILRAFHARGVAHGDLKKKSNLVVTGDGRPCVLDFGATVLYREGLHPFNHWMFAYARQLDLNAWVKHKYHGRYEDARGEDLELLDYSLIERWLRRRRERKA